MTEELDEAFILDSIKAKSDQLNAADLIGGPIVVAIETVTKGPKDQPWELHISGGHQPYKPCKTMRRLILNQWGNNPSVWIGRRLQLYFDPSVLWAGVRAGGIRISHMSDIRGATDIPLPVSRGKSALYHVEPLAPPTPMVERVASACKAYEQCSDAATLEKLDNRISDLISEVDGEQQTQIETARDAAIERANKTSATNGI